MALRQNCVLISILLSALIITSCTTQRYGRQQPISGVEKAAFTCRDIKLQIAQSEEFLNNVRIQRHDTSSAHVMGFLGDFGIGNVMEGDAAELSGEKRLSELKSLSAERGCSS